MIRECDWTEEDRLKIEWIESHITLPGQDHKIKLTDIEKEILVGGRRFRLYHSELRRTGLTTAMILDMLYRAMTTAGTKVLYSTLHMAAARTVYDTLHSMLDKDQVEKARRTNMTVEFKNGSTIRVIGSPSNTIRGCSTDKLYLDNVAWLSDKGIESALSTISRGGDMFAGQTGPDPGNSEIVKAWAHYPGVTCKEYTGGG
jgi:hypothetical protein